ncbi:MAG: hypothetical protein P8Y72_01110 [Anaerolineales bacterium]
MIELLIVAPLERYKHPVPRGFSFTDEMFSEAKLDDPISKAQNLSALGVCIFPTVQQSIIQSFPRFKSVYPATCGK